MADGPSRVQWDPLTSPANGPRSRASEEAWTPRRAGRDAAIVRRVWAELAAHSLMAVTDLLNREGVLRRGGLWTRESVKDLARRGRMYLGYVVEKRGRDERPGCHEPILTGVEYDRTMAAIAARTGLRCGDHPVSMERPPCLESSR